MKNYQKILDKVKKLAWRKLKNESTGHDYWHCYRVVQNALKIGRKKKANLLVLALAGWLHDVAVHPDKEHEIRSAEFARGVLLDLGVDKKTVKQVVNCIKKHRFSKGIKAETLEEKILQDADKLDALGAIGLARLFILGGRYGQTTHNPQIKPDFDYYLKHGRSTTTINHFYDKLFKLRKMLHTKTAQKIALDRERYMKEYLKRFYLEWGCEK
jgi:uncharacterized protein